MRGKLRELLSPVLDTLADFPASGRWLRGDRACPACLSCRAGRGPLGGLRCRFDGRRGRRSCLDGLAVQSRVR
ncbi:MAG: hypothetical protein ACK55I_11095, partial [bacterium]